jgi:sugar phosphate permease
VQEDMRGRVLSIWGLIFRGGAALSLPLLGALADYRSLGFVVTLAGCACLLVSLLMLKRTSEEIQQ